MVSRFKKKIFIFDIDNTICHTKKNLYQKAKPKKSTMAGDIAKFKKGMSKAKPRGRGAGARAYATTGAAVGGTGLAASAGKKSKNPRKRKTA